MITCSVKKAKQKNMKFKVQQTICLLFRVFQPLVTNTSTVRTLD